MKRCDKCGRTYDDEMAFCSNCGGPLSTVQTATKSVDSKKIAWVAIAALVLVLAVILISENAKMARQQQEMEDYRRQKRTEEYLNTPKTTDLTIQDFDDRISGDWIYIDGTVKNTSSKDVRYYEIGVRYYDSKGDVIDTDWTNGTDLGAYEAQSFSIMHKNNWKFDRYSLYIKEVS